MAQPSHSSSENDPESRGEVPPSPSVPDAAPSPPPFSDKADTGCLVLLGVAFLGIFLLPAVVMLGGAPVVIPALFILLAAVLTLILNPVKRSRPRARRIAHALIFFLLCAVAGAVALFLWRELGGPAVLRE